MYAYTGFARDTSRNHNNIGTCKGFCETVVVGEVSLDFGVRRDVRQIRSNTGSVDDIVQTELHVRRFRSIHDHFEDENTNLCDERVRLQQKREGLSNPAYTSSPYKSSRLRIDSR